MPNYKVVDAEQLDVDLTSVADAIREKVNTAEMLHFPDGYAQTIEAIPTGGRVEGGVNFYDYDGTLLYSYTVAQAQRLTELPPLPEHPGLSCQGWNWNLADIKAHNRAVDVGAMFGRNDSTIRIYITLTEGRTSPVLGIGLTGTAIIDWGDGSKSEVLTGTSTDTVQYTPAHHYASAGDYTITVMVNKKVEIKGDTAGSYVLRGENDIGNKAYQDAVRRVILCTRVTLGDYAFHKCSNLTSIAIPKGITLLNGCAFHTCNSLVSIVIPNSVTTIGGSVFYDCNHLSTISVPNSVTSIGGSTFTFCYALKSIVIPNSVTKLGVSLFRRCYGLKSIFIPDGVTTIGDETFKYCHSLASVRIPDNMDVIMASAFYQCYCLDLATLPSATMGIGERAFCECINLKSITILNNDCSIGPLAFEGCSGLVFVRYSSNIKFIYTNTFKGCNGIAFYDFTKNTEIPTLLFTDDEALSVPDDCKIYVPQKLYNEWVTDENWSAYANYIVGT